ncbi:pseudouridine-5'-phosphate glycosidase, partial [Bauldia litoralis]
VFATGGIGGVHRGAEHSFDISADLGELARTGVIVVAAGAKALLDIPKTLEVLETMGVPVVCHGTDAFPAFWSRDSGLPAPIRLDDAAAIAAFADARDALALGGGMLVANPVPAADEIPADEMATHIEAAHRDSVAAGITGKAVTPYLLNAILERTDGRSLVTNIALVKNNARLATEIAIALAA